MIYMKKINLLLAETSFTNDDLQDYPELSDTSLNMQIIKNPYGRRLNASETIDGSLTQIIYTQYESLTIQNNGTNWYIL